jgi:organic radical activating enzyme
MKHYLSLAEFYITNVCNFNCTECNRFSNYRFSGHQLWKDYAEIYQLWSQRIDIDVITILGGEPLLNPGLADWLKGIRGLWPASEIRLVTNGTRLSQWPNLYQLLRDLKIILEVTAHNQLRYDTLCTQLMEMMDSTVVCTLVGTLENWVHTYNAVRDPSWPDCNNIDDFYKLPDYIQQECQTVHRMDPETYRKDMCHLELIDENEVLVTLNYADSFETSPLRYRGNNQFEVYHSDPRQSHNVCPTKYCHNFVRGKLYKCPHMALLPEFRKQYFVDLTTEDLRLLDSYKPLLASDSDDVFDTFLDGLTSYIPQCSLCPSNIELITIHSSTKKLKIKKIPIHLV